MSKLPIILAIAVVASHTLAQVGGGSAAYGQQGRSGVEAARANELAKRGANPSDGRFIDAAVLMNVQADEYVAVFGVNEEGKTLAEARQNMNESIRKFTAGLKQLKIAAEDYYVDFVAQNRIYGYISAANDSVKEIVVGFEVKKTVVIRYRDKVMLDRLTESASNAGIFDLVKVDYIVKDIAAVHSKLVAEASRILKLKADDQERLMGVKVGQIVAAGAPQFSAYYPAEMYDSYVAQESEEMQGWRQGQTVQRARKARTFFFSGLTGKDFDSVVNPVVTEPMVQFTVYVRLRY